MHKFLSIISILIISAISVSNYRNTKKTLDVFVKDKERVMFGIGDAMTSKFLVYTTSETFENTDSILLGKWNSADIQGSIDTNTKYRVTVYGWRVPALSWYRNIITCHKIN